MADPAIKNDQVYTYGDYRKWPDDERWELIEGTAWNMSPAPTRFHQGILAGLLQQIKNYTDGSGCEIYTAPFDVLLPEIGEIEEDDVTSVVQPDISVICDPGKLTDKGCTGAPDWIVEILSPSTSKKDFNNKMALHEKHGVREYWIVDPGNKFVHVYLLGDDNEYPETPDIYLTDTVVSCAVLKGLEIDLSRVFRQ
ncbi:MAG: Uma2 family endonuclease [Spirochaetaceae bacterium]|nr:Uma2 family endonuclease [Spirochaetaceae bacterium]